MCQGEEGPRTPTLALLPQEVPSVEGNREAIRSHLPSSQIEVQVTHLQGLRGLKRGVPWLIPGLVRSVARLQGVQDSGGRSPLGRKENPCRSPPFRERKKP